MEKSLVSVLMPAYNAEKYIGEAIESILNQTYKNFEFIIVDDCSTDNTIKIIEKYMKKDKRIKLYKNKENLNKPKTFNRLIEKMSSKSEFFLLIGADDLFKKDLIKIKIEYFLKNKKLDGLGNSIDYVDEDLNFIKKRIYPLENQDIRKKFLFFSPFSHGGMMLRNKLKKYKYNIKYKVCQDYELWCRLIDEGYYFENLKESHYIYRQSKHQSKYKNLKLTILNTVKIKSKYLFTIRYFNIKALIRYLMEVFSLILPKKIIIWLFYKII